MRKFVVAIASLARLPNSSARGLPYPAGREGKEKGRERERKGERRVTASSSALHYIMTQNGLILAAASRRQLSQHNRYALSLFRALIMAAPRKKTRNTEHYALRRDERE